MQLSFRVKRTLLVATTMFFVLLVAELIKGHGMRAALIFSVIWSAISAAVFTTATFFSSRKGIACPLCDEAPK